MKYKIEGFNQRNAVAIGLKSNDLVFLRWFIDFVQSEKMLKKYEVGTDNVGYWVSYRYIIKELPILFSRPPYIKDDNYQNLSYEEKRELNKKWIKACNKKIQRMLEGNLSKVLIRDIDREKKINKKYQNQIYSKVYLFINKVTYRLLTSNLYNKNMNGEEKTINKDVNNLKTNDDSKSEDIAGQKSPVVGNFIKEKKCPVVTTGQKSTVYPYTKDNSYYNITSKSSNTLDESSNESNINVILIREHTNIKNKGRDFYKTVLSWDTERLKRALEKNRTVGRGMNNTFTYLKEIYNTLPSKGIFDHKEFRKTSFHNFEETYHKYSPDELDRIIEKSQKEKFK